MDRNGNSKFNFRLKPGVDKLSRKSLFKVNTDWSDLRDIAHSLSADYNYEENLLLFSSYSEALKGFDSLKEGL